MKIAILGWGSLLWDLRPEFDGFEKQHGGWKFAGPTLRLEFSRVSESRKEALTLVLETEPVGAPCRVAYALSKREKLEDAVCDLRCREGTSLANIGVCVTADSGKSHGRFPAVVAVIRAWAKQKNIAAVVWTDLGSNFLMESRPQKPFSVAEAIIHLQTIPAEGKAKAAEYVWRAPAFIETPLRSALQAEPWFIAEAPKKAKARKRPRASVPRSRSPASPASRKSRKT